MRAIRFSVKYDLRLQGRSFDYELCQFRIIIRSRVTIISQITIRTRI